MNRKALTVLPLAVPLVALLLGASAHAATVDPSDPVGKAQPAAVATGAQPQSVKTSQLPPLAAFRGYQQVTSALLTDTANTQTSGAAACPSGTRLVGGGVLISSANLAENVNASVPSTDGLTWRVFVNNSSSTSGTFRVYADCVKKVNKYSVVVGTGVANAPGSQNSALVTCPSGTFPLGGGGFASSASTQVNLNTSIPTSNGWRTDVNNASTAGNTATAFAVCGKKPTGYAQVVGAATTLNPSSQGSAAVTCPSGTLVLSGGSYSNTGSTAVDINSSVPAGSQTWIAFQNNGATSTSTLTAFAVCGTSS